MGTITHLAEKGSYTVDDVVCEIEFQGKTTKHTMMPEWLSFRPEHTGRESPRFVDR
jgi:vacuolar-type H+-ATPase catalytic subunit A/Vma1